MLLGRRSSDRAYDRNALRFVEGRAVAWNALCDTPSGKRRGDRLAAVLQSPEAALDVGISQPDGLREKVACRQREARRIIPQLWETPNAGKVSFNYRRACPRDSRSRGSRARGTGRAPVGIHA